MFKKFMITILTIWAIFTINIKTNAIVSQQLSLDEKIGQTLCLDFRYWNDETADSNSSQKPVTQINADIKKIISKYHIGNVILFSENFESKKQAKKLISDLQDTAIKSGNLPLIIATDQEGGKIERFSFGRDRLKNNNKIKTRKEAFDKGFNIGKELKELGINCNFAPVVDVNSNPKNPVINVRSFSNNPNIVSELSKSFLNGLRFQNILATAKHFPGHGDTFVDSHVGLPLVNKTLSEIEQIELKPFQTMINSNIDMIMTAHIQFPKIEKSTIKSKKTGEEIFLPATLSKTFLTDILRKKLGFNGVIITDALNMKAISEHFSEIEAAKKALAAGADVLCRPITLRSKNDITKLDSMFLTLKEAIKSGEIPETQLESSIDRIINLKNKFSTITK